MKIIKRISLLLFVMVMMLISRNEVLAAESNYLWPVPDSTAISQYFTLGINGGEHDGLDITSSWDVPIVASKSGTVVKVLYNQDEPNWGGYGYGVVISHGDGYYTHYAHMSSVSVSANQTVVQGQQIGNMGSTGNSTGRHLHFAIATRIYGAGGRINNNPGAVSYIYNVAASNYIDLGSSFNAIILRTDIWKPIKCVNDNVVLSSTEKHIAQEHWNFIRQSDGSYVIKSLYNGKVLDVCWGATVDETNVWLYEQGTSDNTAQKWYIYGSGNGYKLVPKCAMDKALDVAGGGTSEGTNIQIYTQNGTVSQIFSIYKFTEKGMTSLNLNESTKDLAIGQTYNVSYSCTPTDVTYNKMTWKSSDTSVATVNGSGIVTAVAKGTATITATSVYNDRLTDTMTINVVDECEIELCEWDGLITPAGKEARVATCLVSVAEATQFSSIKIVTTAQKNGIELRQEKEFGPQLIESATRFMFVVDRSDFDNADGNYTTTALLTKEDGTAITKSVTYNFADFSDGYHVNVNVGESIDLEAETGFPNWNAHMFRINDYVSEGSVSKSSDSKIITGVTPGRVYAAFINLSFGTRTLVIIDVIDPSVEEEENSNDEDNSDAGENNNGQNDATEGNNNSESDQEEQNDEWEDANTQQPITEQEDSTMSMPQVGSEKTLSGGQYKVTESSVNSKEVIFVKPKSSKKTSVTIPATVKIDGYTYKVTEISAKAFKNNKKLKSVTIGKNVKKIGKEAFYNCKKLKKITIKSAMLESVGRNAIKNINKKATIKVPKRQLKKYKSLFKSKTGYKNTMKIKK